ncbi:MAG: glycosyltransferase family 2 protein [Candidatus Obscuribacterales bacterium]|nr:glycosyltransferase family 2 protein [Steroidobacteraceae bacterium]
MKVSLCIATYRRPDRLQAVLDDLVAQDYLPTEVVVVDNDPAATARPIVERRRALGAPFPIKYDIQPLKNISLTRNRTVELASSDWLVFIDDDERAPPAWLQQLVNASTLHIADGVLGPVIPILPPNAPRWIQRGRFYDWARMQSGKVVPRNRLRFGNVLLRASLLKRQPTPFDPAYGLTGGEDGDLLARLAQSGARIVWCDEAIVTEPIEAGRLSLSWLLRRALRGGQDFARHTFAGRYEQATFLHRAQFFLRALLQLLLAISLMLLLWPLGRHRAAYWLLKAAANAGKLSVFGGWHYREYGAPTDSSAPA